MSQNPIQKAPLLPEDRIELSAIIKFKESSDSIWITPVCEFFKIGYDHHRKLIKNDPILQGIQRKNADYLAFGDNRQRILLPKVGFIRWIQLINPNTVAPGLREKFIRFQTMVFDYLYGAAEQQAEEARLYTEIQTKRNQRALLAKEIRQAESKLNRIYAIRYGQQQLQLEGGAQ